MSANVETSFAADQIDPPQLPEIAPLQDEALRLAGILKEPAHAMSPAHVFRALLGAEMTLQFPETKKILDIPDDPSKDDVDDDVLRYILATREPYIMYALKTLGHTGITTDQWHRAFEWQTIRADFQTFLSPLTFKTIGVAPEMEAATYALVRLDNFAGDSGSIGKVQKITYTLVHGPEKYARFIRQRGKFLPKTPPDDLSKELEKGHQILDSEVDAFTSWYESAAAPPEPIKVEPKPKPPAPFTRPEQKALSDYLDNLREERLELELEALNRLLNAEGAVTTALIRRYGEFFVSLSSFIAEGNPQGLATFIGTYGQRIYEILRAADPPINIFQIAKKPKRSDISYTYSICTLGVDKEAVLEIIRQAGIPLPQE